MVCPYWSAARTSERFEAIKDDLSATQHIATLPKPFRIDDLATAIDGLLAEASRR
jgi:hypothetical protein